MIQVDSTSYLLHPGMRAVGVALTGGPSPCPQWFAAIDVDRSGELDVRELQRALQMGNLNFGITDVDQMIR